MKFFEQKEMSLQLLIFFEKFLDVASTFLNSNFGSSNLVQMIFKENWNKIILFLLFPNIFNQFIKVQQSKSQSVERKKVEAISKDISKKINS